MDNSLKERVMLERVELIARLTSERASMERDREIALNLIAELAADTCISSRHLAMLASAHRLKNKLKND